jgi:sugar phosphate isomerase/epimerase
MWVCDPVYGHICSTILSHAEEMVEMCEVLGDRYKICVDVGHGTLTQDDPSQMVRIAGDKLVCLHTHDNDGILDRHLAPFAGLVNWKDFVTAMRKVGYKGDLNFETCYQFVKPGITEALLPEMLRHVYAIGAYFRDEILK